MRCSPVSWTPPALPQDSFHDDPLRMLRAARFVSQLGFTLTERVHTAIEQMADEILRISPERVQAELDKLILGDYPVDGIECMVETGLAERVLPEIPAMKLEIDEHHQHKDVYWHSLTVLQQAIDLEDGDPRRGAALGGAAPRHRQARNQTERAGRRGSVSTITRSSARSSCASA